MRNGGRRISTCACRCHPYELLCSEWEFFLFLFFVKLLGVGNIIIMKGLICVV